MLEIDLSALQAVAPKYPAATIIHLQLNGYQPSAKTRPVDMVMCGGQYLRPTDVRVPLAEAFDWPSLSATPADPRPRWSWCGKCIGLAVVASGLTDETLRRITEVARR